jgi:hypothetical protein
MWPALSLILALIVMVVFLAPTLGFLSIPVGVLMGWFFKKFIINKYDPLQPTYKSKSDEKDEV